MKEFLAPPTTTKQARLRQIGAGVVFAVVGFGMSAGIGYMLGQKSQEESNMESHQPACDISAGRDDSVDEIR